MATKLGNAYSKKKYLELEKVVVDLKQQNEQYKKDIDKKDREIAHLKELLHKAIPLIEESGKEMPLIPTDEEIITTIQLARIKDKAEQGPLTYDDVRAFDLLVKNRRLAQNKPTANWQATKIKDITSEKELIDIAEFKTKREKAKDNA